MYRRILTALTLALALAGFVVAVALAGGGQSRQAVIRDQLGEIGAWAVSSSPAQAPEHSQQGYLLDRLGEIGAWAVPTASASG